MKATLFAVVMFGIILSSASSQTVEHPLFSPRTVPVYGATQIASERPFKAVLQGSVWTVAGTLHCGAPACVGGTAEVKISKTSGQILYMIHYKWGSCAAAANQRAPGRCAFIC
jgi:NTF2 fold immunity protein of polymorphic toxin system component